jgi:hypothetical protein
MERGISKESTDILCLLLSIQGSSFEVVEKLLENQKMD